MIPDTTGEDRVFTALVRERSGEQLYIGLVDQEMNGRITPFLTLLPKTLQRFEERDDQWLVRLTSPGSTDELLCAYFSVGALNGEKKKWRALEQIISPRVWQSVVSPDVYGTPYDLFRRWLRLTDFANRKERVGVTGLTVSNEDTLHLHLRSSQLFDQRVIGLRRGRKQQETRMQFLAVLEKGDTFPVTALMTTMAD